MPELSIQNFLPRARKYLLQARSIKVPNWSHDADFSLEPLAQGEYNMNFLIKKRKTAWVLRVNTGSQINLSSADQITYEFKTLKLLEPSGVTPMPYFLDNSLKFLRTYREDVLDAYLFSSIKEVQTITEEWLEEYNAVRPNDALGGLPPYQVAADNIQKEST